MSSPSSPRRSRIAHFKAPFILSLAAPAALGLGCGGKTDTDPYLTSNPPPQTDVKDTTQPQPEDTTACTGERPANDGAGTCGPYWQCVNAEWRQVSSCNPPPPPSTICPESPAEVATSCWGYVGGLRCDYAVCSGTVRRCNESTMLWEALPLASCNPPAPLPEGCTVTLPVPGSDCTVPEVSCSYPGDCEGPSSATCRYGQWLVTYSSGPACDPQPPAPVCPERELVSGEGCAYEGQECGSEACTTNEASHAGHLCAAGVWQDAVLACPIPDNAPDGGAPDGGG